MLCPAYFCNQWLQKFNIVILGQHIVKFILAVIVVQHRCHGGQKEEGQDQAQLLYNAHG
jgi:hypothetical protein